MFLLIVLAALASLALVTWTGVVLAQRAHPPQGKMVEVTGATLHVVEFGPRGAEPIVLLHGASSNLEVMRPLAEHLECEPSNITGLVDRMEARGLVTREPDPEDRRVKNITATDLGRESFEAVWSGLTFAAEPLGALSVAERETLRDLLQRMVPDDAAGSADTP